MVFTSRPQGKAFAAFDEAVDAFLRAQTGDSA
jgi:hypothetical protein